MIPGLGPTATQFRDELDLHRNAPVDNLLTDKANAGHITESAFTHYRPRSLSAVSEAHRRKPVAENEIKLQGALSIQSSSGKLPKSEARTREIRENAAGFTDSTPLGRRVGNPENSVTMTRETEKQ